MTCRGSRFADGAKRNPNGEVFMKNRETDEWLAQNQRSTRNFIRKWGSMVKHDTMMKPIILPKYDIGFVVENCNYNLLYELEPWCSKIYVEPQLPIIDYISNEQKNTLYNLQSKVWYVPEHDDNYTRTLHDIIVEFDGKQLTNENFQYLTQLPEILSTDKWLELGEFELDIFKIIINKIKTYERDLIICKK